MKSPSWEKTKANVDAAWRQKWHGVHITGQMRMKNYLIKDEPQWWIAFRHFVSYILKCHKRSFLSFLHQNGTCYLQVTASHDKTLTYLVKKQCYDQQARYKSQNGKHDMHYHITHSHALRYMFVISSNACKMCIISSTGGPHYPSLQHPFPLTYMGQNF